MESIPENQYEDLTGIELAASVASLEGITTDATESAVEEPISFQPDIIPGEGIISNRTTGLRGSTPHVRSDIADAAFEREEGRLAYRAFKRVFDILFSALIICVLLVPAIILCIIICLDTPGFPIYSQRRVGQISRNGEIVTFNMYKFRSMHDGAESLLPKLQGLNEADGPLFKIKDDPRVTRVGHFIRKHSIDELPQFLNCFLGQLSTVGPRPPLLNEVERYDKHAMRRLSVKPGLTGYWQIRGRSDTSFDDMVNLDLKYIRQRCALVDFRVIARTVTIICNGKGSF